MHNNKFIFKVTEWLLWHYSPVHLCFHYACWQASHCLWKYPSKEPVRVLFNCILKMHCSNLSIVLNYADSRHGLFIYVPVLADVLTFFLYRWTATNPTTNMITAVTEPPTAHSMYTVMFKDAEEEIERFFCIIKKSHSDSRHLHHFPVVFWTSNVDLCIGCLILG